MHQQANFSILPLGIGKNAMAVPCAECSAGTCQGSGIHACSLPMNPVASTSSAGPANQRS